MLHKRGAIRPAIAAIVNAGDAIFREVVELQFDEVLVETEPRDTLDNDPLGVNQGRGGRARNEALSRSRDRGSHC
jgi:hypothetical protein